jgi:ankyrin repeat protein
MLLGTQAATAGVYEDILHATKQGDNPTVINLLRRGMDVNTTDTEGMSLLMIAAENNNLELLRFLLDNRVNAQRRNRHGDTALMIAALRGHIEVVRLMLDRKVDPNHPGWNALHYAAFENRSAIISLLLAAGAEINALAPNRQTALMFATKNGHQDTVRVLVGSGADLAHEDPQEGTALAMAKKAGHTDIAQFLVRAGAK